MLPTSHPARVPLSRADAGWIGFCAAALAMVAMVIGTARISQLHLRD